MVFSVQSSESIFRPLIFTYNYSTKNLTYLSVERCIIFNLIFKNIDDISRPMKCLSLVPETAQVSCLNSSPSHILQSLGTLHPNIRIHVPEAHSSFNLRKDPDEGLWGLLSQGMWGISKMSERECGPRPKFRRISIKIRPNLTQN
jgi:hypothetical protein